VSIGHLIFILKKYFIFSEFGAGNAAVKSLLSIYGYKIRKIGKGMSIGLRSYVKEKWRVSLNHVGFRAGRKGI
jgi:hypothetical protein